MLSLNLYDQLGMSERKHLDKNLKDRAKPTTFYDHQLYGPDYFVNIKRKPYVKSEKNKK